MSKIFVSHASADRLLVDPFVDDVIRSGSEVNRQNLIYTSGTDTRIPSGTNLNAYVQNNVGTADLIIAVISPNFRASAYCMAELGAAWVQAGTLFPIGIPGYSYGDVDGVLEGLLVRNIDDDVTLDELHDAICRVTGARIDALTWGKYRVKWLASVASYTARLPVVETYTAADMDRARLKLEGTQAALRDSEEKCRVLQGQLQEMAAIRVAADVEAVLLPADEEERFEALREKASDLLGKLPGVVGDAMFFDWTGPGMGRPTDQWEAIDFDRAVSDGYLAENGNELISPNRDSLRVENAYNAVEDLGSFLDETSSEFGAWFRRKYDMSPDLRKKVIWRALLMD